MAAEGSSSRDAVDEMYLSFYSRPPTATERENAIRYFEKAKSRREAIEDLGWSLMNSYEFLFNH